MKYVQRSRKKGDKQPPNTRYCGRGTKYGNMFEITEYQGSFVVDQEMFDTKQEAHEYATDCYRHNMKVILSYDQTYFDELLQYDHLSCFCDPSLPCHVKDAIIPHLVQREKELKG